jgi:hypothetical protein
MLKELLVGRARSVIPEYRLSEAEAREDGARFIEAEHVLLALAASDTDAGRLLVGAGLDRDRLAGALREERRRSLSFAGMEHLTKAPTPSGEVDRAISLGTSAKDALRRGLHAQADRQRRTRLDSIGLLIGVLQAELGTVARALALAGVERSALIARARTGEG